MGRKSREKRERRQHEEMLQRHYLNPTPPQKYPAQGVASKGLTAAERELAKLCRHTFLSSWSYPNVFRAERSKRGAISKELCDLLVVFEEHVIVFSDKDCAFPASDDISKDWARWYRRAVRKSALQLYGAERVIRRREPLFLDAQLNTPFPLQLPDPAEMRIHRVLVAHSVSERCRAAHGGNGTLIIRPSIVADDHLKSVADGGVPFAIGQLNPAKGYIHVLDDASLVLLLRTLDTAPDLIAYLSKRGLPDRIYGCNWFYEGQFTLLARRNVSSFRAVASAERCSVCVA